jgi:hypothetical protein
MRADVLDGGHVTGGAPEEADLLAQHRDLHRLAGAHLAVVDGRIPVVAQAEGGIRRRMSPLSFGMAPFAAGGVMA